MNPFAAAAGSLTPRIGDHAAAASAEPFPTESTSLKGGPEVTGTQKNNVAGSDGVGAAMQPAVADPFGHETIRASQSRLSVARTRSHLSCARGQRSAGRLPPRAGPAGARPGHIGLAIPGVLAGR